MTALVNIAVWQSPGDTSALRLLDAAQYLRHQLQRVGHEVKVSKNRLLFDAVNVVLGAERGFDPGLRASYAVVLANLVQLDDPDRPADPWYVQLLADTAVIDYDPANVAVFRPSGQGARLLRFGAVPVAAPQVARTHDLLVLGDGPMATMALGIADGLGLDVVRPECEVYGPERDELLASCRAVLLTQATPRGHIDHALVARALSLGTAVLAQLPGSGFVDQPVVESVQWVEGSTLAPMLAQLRSDGFAHWTAEAVARFAGFDPLEDAVAVGDLLDQVARSLPARERRLVRQIHIGSGRAYMPGWFNVDIDAATRPDAVLDLSQPLHWPLDVDSPTTGPMRLEAGEVQHIYANNVLEHVGDLPTLMTNCLDLLAVGGELVVAVPYEHSNAAWQDPTHVRAMNEGSWLYYTAWFWYLGWLEHRFSVRAFEYLTDEHQPAPQAEASQMRVEFVKVPTTAEERMIARTMRSDFGMPDLVA